MSNAFLSDGLSDLARGVYDLIFAFCIYLLFLTTIAAKVPCQTPTARKAKVKPLNGPYLIGSKAQR